VPYLYAHVLHEKEALMSPEKRMTTDATVEEIQKYLDSNPPPCFPNCPDKRGDYLDILTQAADKMPEQIFAEPIKLA